MNREDLARLEADVRSELAALQDYADNEADVNEIEPVEGDILALDEELAFVEMEKRRVDLVPRCDDASVAGDPIEKFEDPSADSAVDAAVGSDALDDASLVGDLIEDIEGPPDESTDDTAEESDANDETPAFLGNLSTEEAKIIRMRFGIACDGEHTPEEIATKLGLTIEQVREIEARALYRLRAPEQSRRLREFMRNRQETESA
jgi:DNA-directed RNA polymerase specialized sigma24 family protein